jgi:Leucine-rich repeat (LRR) protein
MELNAELVQTLIQTKDAGRSKAAGKDLLLPKADKSTLDFRSSQIEEFGLFSTYANIVNKYRTWDLSQNYIKDIPSEFTEFSKLSGVLISENVLSRMIGFDNNMYLQLLDLSNNQITKIEGLTNLPELRILVGLSV